MKKLVGFLTVLWIGLGLVGCGGNEEATDGDDFTVVRVGVVGAFQDQWDAVNAALYDEGIRVELVHFTEWTLPNPALNDGEIDLNAFQSTVFFDNAILENDYDLAIVGTTFVSPMNIFNGRLEIPADPERASLLPYIEDGTVVGLPSDPVNLGRALQLLQAAGLIELDPAVGFLAAEVDIVNFHVELEFVLAEANTLPQLLPDLDIAVISAPQALANELSARDESLFREDALNVEIADGLVNMIASRAGDENDPVFQRIAEAYQSEAVADVFEHVFDGAFIPAW